MTWVGGRQLAGMTDGTDTLGFAYNEKGLRTEKTVNNVTRKYIWNDSQLITDIGPADAFYFRYNSGGDMLGYRYKAGNTETECVFVKNQQGDVERILDAGTGTVLASYTYDAWGKVLASDGDLANDNPIRYRGYYFDTETELYYIGSRYYDPEVCRFINADDVTNLGANGDFASTNLFAYCGNNPVYRFDPEGTDWHTAFKVGVAVFLVGALVLATLPFSGPLLAGAGVAAASVSSAAYTAMAAGGIMAGESLAVGIIKQSTRDADPYRRPDQKKQGRELKSKARTKDSFKSRNNRRDGMPARPKHHTPGNDHKKYSVFVFWQKNEER